jgi:hypothetical protein
MNGKEDVEHKYNEVLFSYKEWNYVFSTKMNGTGDYYIKWDKPNSGR